MAFMSKDKLHSEAKRLGVSLDGLTFPQMQKAVIAAQMAEKESASAKRIDTLDDHDIEVVVETTADEVDKLADAAPETVVPKPIPQRPITVHRGKAKTATPDPESPEQYVGKRILISPEMAQTSIQLIKYDEELGQELTVEEKSYKNEFEAGADFPMEKDLYTATYKIKGSTGKKVIAQSTLPKENAGIDFRIDRDLFPVVRFKGHVGYLWTHQRLPNVKAVLKQSGYYEKYKKHFIDDPNAMWHAGGLLVVDAGITLNVIRMIEDEERNRRERGHISY